MALYRILFDGSSGVRSSKGGWGRGHTVVVVISVGALLASVEAGESQDEERHCKPSMEPYVKKQKKKTKKCSNFLK